MLRKIIVGSFLFVTGLFYSQVQWMDFSEAIEANKHNPKKIVITFYSDQCGNCKKMDKTTFLTPEIYNYINENYYPIKFNVSSKKPIQYRGRSFSFDKNLKLHSFVNYMNASITPSLVFLDEKTNPITILQGRLTAKELDPYLQFFGTDKHLTVKTKRDWENYIRKFKSSIK